jgi:DNA invertase Pin-like site-specific DNA recombinase
MGKRVALYGRVSTADGQTVENQLRELRAVADRLGWQIVVTFVDEGISGAKGREKRPGYNALLKAITRREVDLVAAWSVCRLGRSLKDLVAFLGEVEARGVGIYLHVQGLDSSTPAGRAMFSMMAVFAEFERSMVIERVKAGLARARAQGRRCGRPPIDATRKKKVRELLGRGLGILKTAKTAGVGVSTVYRVRAEAAATEPA